MSSNLNSNILTHPRPLVCARLYRYQAVPIATYYNDYVLNIDYEYGEYEYDLIIILAAGT